MLDLTAKSLIAEVRRWEKYAQHYHAKSAQLTQVISSNNYLNDANVPETDRIPENYAYAYKQFVRPQLLFGTPSPKARPCRSVDDQPVADAHTYTLADWIRQTNYKGTLSEIIDDVFVGFGVTKKGLEKRGEHMSGNGLPAVQGDFEQVPMYPFSVRVPPKNFIADADAKKLSRCRLLGERFQRDLDDAKADERYKPEAKEMLVAALDNFARKGDPYPPPAAEAKSRDRVDLIELYIPEAGVLITLADLGSAGGDAIELMRAPFIGPDEGPYTLWGLDSIPGQLLPCPPLMALFDEFMELQEHARAAARAAASHKKIAVGPLHGEKDAETIKNTPSGKVCLVQDPKSVVELEIGGATDTQMEFCEYLRLRLDRNMGFTDAQRGAPTSGGTATENTIANTNSDLRLDGMRDRIHDCLKHDLRGVMFYFHNIAEIGRFDMAFQDEQTGETVSATFLPGHWTGGYVPHPDTGEPVWIPAQPENDYTDFALDLDVRSMTKQDDAIEALRAQEELTNIVIPLSQILGPQMINWRRVIDDYGSATNRPNLSKQWLIDTMGMMMPLDPLNSQLAMQQQQQPQQGQQPPSQSGRGGSSGATTQAGQQGSVQRAPAAGLGPTSPLALAG